MATKTSEKLMLFAIIAGIIAVAMVMAEKIRQLFS